MSTPERSPLPARVLYEISPEIIRDENQRRTEFAVRILELADEFDSLDHTYGPIGGTSLQEDCAAVRGLARSIAAKTGSEPASSADSPQD